MYKILIADDEYWVGRWLKEVLDRCPFEVETAGVCQDGEEALRFLEKTPVDILITDINMPVVNGLDLIRGAGNMGRKLPKAIVISGYDEFEYARQAIELDVLAYLIKPLERQALHDAVKKAVDSLDKEQIQRMNVQTGYQANIESLLAEFFRHPQENTRQKLKEILSRNGFDGKYYLIGIIQNTSLENALIPREELREKLKEACRNSHVFLFRRDTHTWAFLLAGIQRADGFFIEENILLKILNGYVWGTSGLHSDPEELLKAAGEARNAIIRKLRNSETSEEESGSEEYQNSDFLSAVEARDKERVKLYSDMAEERFLKAPYDLTGCLNFYFVMAGEVIKLLTDSYQRQKDDTLLKLVDEGYEFSVQIHEFYSIRPICQKFKDYCFRVIDSLNETGPMTVSDIVQKVQRVIKDQYATDLNLGSIAEEFSINPSYFSKKFKDETGVNFVDYLSGVRIEQAKSLLKNTDLPISQISARVGFKDPKYFSKVFLSLTDKKPSEYRSKWKEGGRT